jgi:pimeloyl-ACP methyl ester carboxylesterase
MMTLWTDVPTQTVDVGGTRFAYRELGPEGGVPVVFLHHLMAVLDDWDPSVIDGLAAHRRVITFDNRGVGGTGGKVPDTIDEMGRDAIAFIRALGLRQVDLFGFSLGGGVAQMVALQAPDLVRRIVLAGTGPKGGGGINEITKIATAERDKKISLQARRAQLKAIRAAGLDQPDDLSMITQPVFVANGDHDLMVASSHSADMARRLPNATLTIYPNSGHGGVFQHHDRFVPAVVEFLGG